MTTPPLQSNQQETYLTTGQASRLLQIAPGTLQNWRSLGTGPKFIKHRRNVYYAKSEIERYRAESFISFSSTAEWKELADQRTP